MANRGNPQAEGLDHGSVLSLFASAGVLLVHSSFSLLHCFLCILAPFSVMVFLNLEKIMPRGALFDWCKCSRRRKRIDSAQQDIIACKNIGAGFSC